MYSFDYHRPKSIRQAVKVFDKADDPMYMGGGMTLIPTMKQRLAAPTDVIDLSVLDELTGIESRDDHVIIGALTTHNQVAESDTVLASLPVLAEVAQSIGDNQVRNRGTLGGSVANSDPAADYPAAVIGLGAQVITPERTIQGDEFFRDLFETALVPGEVITHLSFPIPRRAAYAKFRNQASGYAIVGVLVADFGDRIRVGVTGAGPCAFRASGMEEVLADDLSPEALDGVSVPDVGFNSDIHASAEYRAHLLKVMAKRAVQSLLSPGAAG